MERGDEHGLVPMDATQGLLSQPLASLYSMTFDEFQTTLGVKDCGSMNIDELLRSIWSAEENQTLSGLPAPGEGIQGHGSGLLNLPRTLSEKTVDEVWRDHFQEQERLATLGEMTIEEFLVRANATRDNLNVGCSSNILYEKPASANNPSMLSFGLTPVAQAKVGIESRTMQNSLCSNLGMPVVNQPVVLPLPGRMVGTGQMGDPLRNTGLKPEVIAFGEDIAFPVNQHASDVIPMNNVGVSVLSALPYLFNGAPREKRANGGLEKVTERRQRRMIKNRESAARSRARKQAYTMELEAELEKLKEKNAQLQKKQIELLEVQKIQVMHMINLRNRPKITWLRRTQTGP